MFRLTFHLYHHQAFTDSQMALLRANILELKELIMVTKAEVDALTEQVARNRGEVLAKIAALEEALANSGNPDPAVEAAFTALKAEVQGADDDVVPPDAPPAEDPEV